MSTTIGRSIIKAVEDDDSYIVDLSFRQEAAFKIDGKIYERPFHRAFRYVLETPKAFPFMLFGNTQYTDIVFDPKCQKYMLKLEMTVYQGSDTVFHHLPLSYVAPYLLPSADYTGESMAVRRAALNVSAFATAAAATAVHELTHVMTSEIYTLPRSELPSNFAEILFFAELGIRR